MKTPLQENNTPQLRRWLRPRMVRNAIILFTSTGLLATVSTRVEGSATHTWTGASSGYWSTTANWQLNDRPNGDGTETLTFPTSVGHYQNTNDFVPLQPATHVTYQYLHIDGGGYTLYGNPLRVISLRANYPAGSTSTIRFDLLEALMLYLNQNNSSLTLAGDLILTNGDLNVYGSGDCVISGVISGDGIVFKTDSSYGELRMSGLGANTYTGRTLAQGGILRLGRYRFIGALVVGAVAVPGNLFIGTGTNVGAGDLVVLERDNQIADTSTVYIEGSGQLDLNDHSDTISYLNLTGGSVVTRTGTLTVKGISANLASGPSVIAGNLELGASDGYSFYVGLPDGRLEIPANITGSADLRSAGSGEVWLAGSNSFTGRMSVQGGNLIVAHPHALGSGSPGTNNDTRFAAAGSTLGLDHVTVTNELLTVRVTLCRLRGWGTCGWAGDIDFSGVEGMYVDSTAGSVLTLSGRLDGPQSSLDKSGPGKLLVMGTHTNSVRGLIVWDGTVGGSGIVQNIFLMASSAKLAPGASVGRLTAQGQVYLTNGTFEVELNGLTPGTGYDQLVTDVAPALGDPCALNVLVGFTPAVGSTFTIINNRSASPALGTFSGKPQNAYFQVGDLVFQISYTGGTGNDVVLTRVAGVPVSDFVAALVGGQMQFQARGFVGSDYVLEAAPHLNAPIPWIPLKTNTANASGQVQFVDGTMSQHTQRFYRIVPQ